MGDPQNAPEQLLAEVQALRERLAARERAAAERRAVEERLRRVNQLYSALTRIHEVMVRVREPARLHEEICRIAVETGGLRMAWVGMVDAATGAVRPVASWGHVVGYLDNIRIVIAAVPEGRGPVGTAIRETRPDVIADVAADPRMDPWREQCLQRGYHSVAALPLVVRGQPIGILALYAAEPGYFDGDEVAIMKGLANDLAFAIERDEEERRRRAEEERERFVALVENSSDWIAIAAPDNTLLYLNPAARRLAGLDRPGAVTPNLAVDLAQGDFRRQLEEVIIPAANREGRWEGEVRAFSAAFGRFLDLHLSTFLIRDPKTGASLGRADIARDLTEPKRLEAQLREAQKMAAAGQLAGGVAHNFNNLLTVITGYSDLLLDGLDRAGPLWPFAREIRKAADRAADLTRQLVAFSRKQVLQPCPIDLNAFIANYRPLLGRLLGERVELRHRAGAASPSFTPTPANSSTSWSTSP